MIIINTYFKHYFIFFNVNEHLLVPVVELIISKSVWVSPFLLFTRDYLSGVTQLHRLNLSYCSKSSVTWILLSV